MVGDVVICKWILCKFTDNTITNTNKITITPDNIGNRHLKLDPVVFCGNITDFGTTYHSQIQLFIFFKSNRGLKQTEKFNLLNFSLQT